MNAGMLCLISYQPLRYTRRMKPLADTRRLTLARRLASSLPVWRPPNGMERLFAVLAREIGGGPAQPQGP